MKIVVYTAVFGNYDHPGNLTAGAPDNVRFICYSDEPHYTGWDNVFAAREYGVDKPGLTRSNRYYKFNLQPEILDSDINVYVDGCIQEIYWPEFMAKCEELWNSDLDAIFIKHPRPGGTTRAEIDALIQHRWANPMLMEKQYQSQINDGFKDDVHIVASNTQFRKTKADGLNHMLYLWWQQVINWAHRDQIGFGYAVYKSGFTNYKLITREERGKIFVYGPHRKI